MEKRAQLDREGRLAYIGRCKALGVRPGWEREFCYYPPTERAHLAENVRLAAAYPLAAWEQAREDESFQTFLARMVPLPRK